MCSNGVLGPLKGPEGPCGVGPTFLLHPPGCISLAGQVQLMKEKSPFTAERAFCMTVAKAFYCLAPDAQQAYLVACTMYCTAARISSSEA